MTKKNPSGKQGSWQELLALSRVHQIEWIKVKGHADSVENNRCDELARAAIKQYT